MAIIWFINLNALKQGNSNRPIYVSDSFNSIKIKWAAIDNNERTPLLYVFGYDNCLYRFTRNEKEQKPFLNWEKKGPLPSGTEVCPYYSQKKFNRFAKIENGKVYLNTWGTIEEQEPRKLWCNAPPNYVKNPVLSLARKPEGNRRAIRYAFMANNVVYGMFHSSWKEIVLASQDEKKRQWKKEYLWSRGRNISGSSPYRFVDSISGYRRTTDKRYKRNKTIYGPNANWLGIKVNKCF